VMFQGANAEEEASKWDEKTIVKPTLKKAASVNSHSYQPPKQLFDEAHIGTDETGTGDFFGPITVCAVYLSKNNLFLLKDMGITDSKTLTDERITKLAVEMVRLGIPYSLLTLDNAKYNQLQQRGWNQGKMKSILHQHAIEKLIKKLNGTSVNGILIDQFCQPHSYMKHINSERLSLAPNTFFMTKAESYSTSVAAASIIARAKFVREMDHLSEKYGFTIPKGASSKVDESAAYFIKKNGIEELSNVAKIHFANTE